MDHQAPVYSLSFTTDGSWLATAAADGTVRLWSVPDGRPGPVIEAPMLYLTDVQLHPTRPWLAVTGLNGPVALLDRQSGRLVQSMDNDGAAWGVRFGADGSTLAAGIPGEVRIWHLDGKLLHTLGPVEGQPIYLDFSPDSNLLGCPLDSGTAHVWDLRTGHEIVLDGHRAGVNTLRFAPTGDLVATASDDGTVMLWQPDTGQRAWHAPVLLHRPVALLTHAGWTTFDPRTELPEGARWWEELELRAQRADRAPDGSLLCVASPGGAVSIWDTDADRSRVVHHDVFPTQLRAHPSGCAAVGRDGGARLLLPDGQKVGLAEGAGAISVDGDQILVSVDRDIRRLDLSGASLGTFEADVDVTAIHIVGELAVLGYQEGSVELRSAATGDKLLDLQEVPSSPVTAIHPGPTGIVAVGFASGAYGLWSTDTGVRLHSGKLHGPLVHLHQDGPRLIAATELGDHEVLDLDVFDADYCSLLRDVWHEVPVIWTTGRAELRLPPEGHICIP